MKHGVITSAQDWPQKTNERLAGSRQQWIDITGGVPDYYPILHRLGDSDIETTCMHLKTIPGVVLYLTSVDHVDEGELSLLSNATKAGTIVRFNHEPNARDWIEATWTSWTPEHWGREFNKVRSFFSHALVYACFIWTRRSPGDWAPYIKEIFTEDVGPPYHADVVLGFDAYVQDKNRARDIDLLKRYGPSIDYLVKVDGKPILIGEFGIEKGTAARRSIMRQVLDLDNVAGVVWMDWDRWQLGPRARNMLGEWMRKT